MPNLPSDVFILLLSFQFHKAFFPEAASGPVLGKCWAGGTTTHHLSAGIFLLLLSGLCSLSKVLEGF